METPEVSFVQKPPRRVASAKKSVVATDDKENIKKSRVVISPIKQAALTKAFGPSATSTSAKKLKLALPKVQKAQAAVPGTPQPMDPSNILKRNMKQKVETQLDKKVQEIPKSPYTLLIGETENGSPVEHFVKMAKKPSKENVTGTPAPVRRSARKAFTPIMDNNVQAGSPHPNPMKNRLGTPKKLDMTVEAMDVETENQAINKTLAKVNSPPAQAANQMITGDLAKMCAIM